MRRAIISVYDKTGIEELAFALRKLGWEIVSSGGTARFLQDKGVKVIEVSQVTEFQEILDGRVKTLHPKIHGGILAIRDNPNHLSQLKQHDIFPVDMVVCNLYPFVKTASQPDAAIQDVIEQIDIGGPSLLRAAAKNFHWVVAVCNPQNYDEIIRQIETHGEISLEFRKKLAHETFVHTASYDAAISAYFASVVYKNGFHLSQNLFINQKKVLRLRYGENPHQKAAYYEPSFGKARAGLSQSQIQGKQLSYNNINDLDNAFHVVWDLGSPGCVIVKHAAPCGAAVGETPEESFKAAFLGDDISAFGGVVCFNCEVDQKCAQAMAEIFLEVVAAPKFTKGALEILKRKKNLRLLILGPIAGHRAEIKTALGGILVQEKDSVIPSYEHWQTVSQKQPTAEQLKSLEFAMTVCKHVKSNSIVLAQGCKTVGIGGGQPNRVDAVKIAVARAGERAKGSCLASDAFFPFPDSIHEAAKAGISAIAHVGGSVKDQDCIDAADEHGVAMVFTGKRHFLH